MDGIAAPGLESTIDEYAAEVDYTIEYLEAAITFTRDLASAGQGMVYLIG